MSSNLIKPHHVAMHRKQQQRPPTQLKNWKSLNKRELCELSSFHHILRSVERRAGPLRCFIVPQKSRFPRSLCGTVSRAPTLLSFRRYTATHRGALILTLPSLAQTTIMRLLSQTSSTHSLLGLCSYIVQTQGSRRH